MRTQGWDVNTWIYLLGKTSGSETTSLAWSRVQYNFEPTTMYVLSEYQYGMQKNVSFNNMQIMVTHPYMTFDLTLLGTIYVQVPKDHLYPV